MLSQLLADGNAGPYSKASDGWRSGRLIPSESLHVWETKSILLYMQSPLSHPDFSALL